MTVPPRGVRSRRSGRRPGWLLLTALLVLAILAGTTLVFTNRVELLRLAVILSLWAAVLAAFVSVIYRRQSQVDEARARDMKFVYDLQLDREISARREYELAVEAHLRRQLGHELRAQAADEMAALRMELSSLRGHLEVLLGTDLGDRPALESDRVAEPLAMQMPPPPDRVESSRITAVVTEAVTTRVEMVEQVIRDAAQELVTEEVVTEEVVTEEVVAEEVREIQAEAPIIDVPEEPLVSAAPISPPRPAPQPYPVMSPPPPYPVTSPPLPYPVTSPPLPYPTDDRYRASHRSSEPPQTPWRPPETQTRRGRHWTPDDAQPAPGAPPAPQPAGYSAEPRGRHWSEPEAPVEAPAARHRDGAEPVVETPHSESTGGYSVADLMARLQVDGPSGGGGRRRRED